MKVIEATQEPGWRKQMRCTAKGNGGKGCGSLLEVEMDDLRFCSSIDTGSWGDREAAVMFKCPICGDCTDLDKADWPRGYNRLTEFTRAWMDAPVTAPEGDKDE